MPHTLTLDDLTTWKEENLVLIGSSDNGAKQLYYQIDGIYIIKHEGVKVWAGSDEEELIKTYNEL